jgi:glutaminyl-peptide cyclotransferase
MTFNNRAFIAIILVLFIFIGEGCTNQREAIDYPKIDLVKSFSYLTDQVNFGPRYIGTDAHEKCADYIRDNVKMYADKVDEQYFPVTFRGENVQCRNIIALFNGNKDEKWYLIGAHYDTRPIADHDPDPAKRNEPILGANDGASGVAVLLSMAESLKKLKAHKNVMLIFLDAEDAGGINGLNYCLGSEYFAGNHDSYKVDYGIILDMIGDTDLLVYKEKNSVYTAPELVKALWKSAWLKKHGDNFSYMEKYTVYDDHMPLNMSGIPTIDVIDFDYPSWHTRADLPDKCSPRSLYIIGDSVLNFIYNYPFPGQ